MSLTINTHPTKQVINAPEFNVTTSLTEGASFQNLRIRATIYIGGKTEAVAVLEQAKGLDDWDFFNLLKDHTGKCNAAVGGADIMITPTLSAELLTTWTNFGSSWDTFTTAVRTVISAINLSGSAIMTSDVLSISKGDVIVVGVEQDFADIGAVDVALTLSTATGSTQYDTIQYAGLNSGKLKDNNLYFFVASEDSYTTPNIAIATTGASQFAGTFSIHTISDFKNNPGAYFKVKFEEVYENASNVTTIGAESLSDALLFIPAAVRPDETFNGDYLINEDDTGNLLTRQDDADLKYKFGIGQEMRFLGASNEGVNIHSTYDDGSPTDGSDVPNAGWFMMIANDTTIAGLTAILASFTIGVEEEAAAWAPVNVTVNTELNCYPDFSALSFVGELGEETILFRGLESITGTSQKTFFRNSNLVRRVASAFKAKTHILRTLYENEETRLLLHELTYTDKDVWMYDTDFTANYREVGVISDAVPIEDRNELIENEIEIEYFE